jgi:hypothetical protein
MEEQKARASRWYRIPASWSGCKLEQIQRGAKESPKSGSIWQVSYATWATCRYAHVEGQAGDASRQTEHQDVDLPVLMISFAGVAWHDASCHAASLTVMAATKPVYHLSSLESVSISPVWHQQRHKSLPL